MTVVITEPWRDEEKEEKEALSLRKGLSLENESVFTFASQTLQSSGTFTTPTLRNKQKKSEKLGARLQPPKER